VIVIVPGGIIESKVVIKFYKTPGLKTLGFLFNKGSDDERTRYTVVSKKVRRT
jgi:hypothetical protein